MPTSKFYFLVITGVFVYLLLPLRSANTDRAATRGMPGVGISLTVDYGIISLRKEDGSYEDVGRIEGDEEYLEVMQRLSAQEAEHARYSPPYESMEELWSDWRRQLVRRTRLGVGLSASADVGVLSRMLGQLLDLPTTTPGISLRQIPVVISYPAIYGLYQEDIADAAAYLGVQVLTGNHSYQPRNMVAAYAGHGLGLCKTYQDREACRQEGLDMPVNYVLLVEHTERALLQHTGIMRETYDLADRHIDIAADFTLGNHHKSGDDSAARISQAVLRFLQTKYKNRGPPEKIVAILIGNDIHERLAKAVREAVTSFGSQIEVLDSDGKFVAARGAAELAWRSIESAEETEL